MIVNVKNISLILFIVIICAYIFGTIMISVFKSKLDDFKLNDLEHFISKKNNLQEEEEDTVRSESIGEEDINISNSQLSKILQSSLEITGTLQEEEKNFITKRNITPKNILLNQNTSEEEDLYNININNKNDLVTLSNIQPIIEENNDEYVVVKKKYLIENYNNLNKKNQIQIDNEFSKSFGPKSNANEVEGTKINGFSQIENKLGEHNSSVWNFDYEKHDVIKNLCFHNHTHSKDCIYGNTNYADPRTMSIIEKRTFILNYPPNMTMQDYINWLYCFVGKEDQLPYNHLKNLEKLKKGIHLVKEDGVCPPPAQYFPPLDSEKYFKNMYDAKSHEIAFAPKLNSNTGSLVGANFNQYSEFSQNFDVYGSTGSIVNPDIAYKKNAKDLDNIIKPKNGNDLELQKKYKPYFVKNIEV